MTILNTSRLLSHLVIWLIAPVTASADYFASTNYPQQVYWGDTHVHSKLSFDSYPVGNRLGPDAAYRFAKGQAVTAFDGRQAQRRRPLDFLVIADHARAMGVIDAIADKRPSANAKLPARGESGLLAKIAETLNFYGNSAPDQPQISAASALVGKLSLEQQRPFVQSAWEYATRLADQHNQPGKFTAFIGYEWTPPFNLHRVVIFKDGADLAGRTLPLPARPAATHADPQRLWDYLQGYEADSGGEVLAIPHNGNLSDGVMFALQDAKGHALSRAYAETRSRWEPLYEVTQVKGDSETHPLLSPNDRFADFETFIMHRMGYGKLENERQSGYKDYQNWHDRKLKTHPNHDWMRPYEYARSALKLGLQQQASLGVNPFKFGMIGSTDTHNSLSTAEEDNFWGKYPSAVPSKVRLQSSWDPANDVLFPITPDLYKKYPHGVQGWRQNAAGYAAVWAVENTREALFAAMKRKEVYASTGPRMTVRFFGGWDYQVADAFKPNLAQLGYAGGVPMGGDLTSAPTGKAPRFLIRAVKDPEGANLDRVQVVKGWHDQQGNLHEKIYNVALADGRKENRQGQVKPVGSTVDIADASYTNTIGDPELAVVWEDPSFDKDALAFYYVRVIEIPTPRWPAYDAKAFGVTDIPTEVTMVTQERAYTSPIWYTP